MKILIEIAHPKHFLQFKSLISIAPKEVEYLFIARDKDVVIQLMESSNYQYKKYGSHGKTLIQKLLVTPKILWDYFNLIRVFKPNIIISRSSPYAIFFKYLFKIRVIVFPDSEVVPIINKFVAPRSDLIITPANFSLNYGKHHLRVDGLFEESYLHPKVFKPKKSIKNRLGKNGRYFILRFVGWHANHDINQFGFSFEQKIKLVEFLEQKGTVYISSETTLPENLLKYKLDIDPADIHSALHFADLYIGDSQTMATEAALLGTPSLRFNSFVGSNDMSNFILLEEKYKMLYNFKSFNELLQETSDICQNSAAKSDWLEKRMQYFESKKDISEESFKLLSEYFSL